MGTSQLIMRATGTEMAANYVHYEIPQPVMPPPIGFSEVFLVANDYSRLPPSPRWKEQRIVAAFGAQVVTVKRVHPYEDTLKQGFIWNQLGTVKWRKL